MNTYLFKEINKDYFNIHFFVLKLFGISIKPVENSITGIMYKIYSVILFVLCFIGYPTSLFFFLYLNADLENATLVLCFLLTYILGTFKLIIILIFKRKITTFSTYIENEPFLPDNNRSNDKEFIYVEDAIRTCNNQGYIFHFLVVLIVVQRLYYAANDAGYDKQFWDFSTNTTLVKHVKSTPFYTVLPFEPIDFPYYEITVMYQTYCSATYGFVIGATDAIICGIMCHIKAQLLILKNCLKTYIQRGIYLMKEDKIDINIREFEKYQEPKVDTFNVHKVPLVFQKYVEISITQLMRHHQKILELAEGAEDTFSFLMLIQFLFSLALICFQLFQLSIYTLPSVKFFSMLSYLLLMLYQIFVYCYHGNEVMLYSLSVIDAVFESNWVMVNIKCQKSLLLLMLRASRPIKMTAGKFVYLSLESFMSIVRGSGSYFMVLTNMNARKQ
uniref:Odorant receptor n=1 Tax=Holotrichia parallela TaxID=93412 RepID=A0A2P9JY72_HOLPA|nr:odorant receptor 34 [Holotrichia parallela]